MLFGWLGRGIAQVYIRIPVIKPGSRFLLVPRQVPMRQQRFVPVPDVLSDWLTYHLPHHTYAILWEEVIPEMKLVTRVLACCGLLLTVNGRHSPVPMKKAAPIQIGS